MAHSSEEGYDQRVLMAGDSRLKRLRNIPCEQFPLHSIDFVIVNGISILDLIEKVDEQLSPNHAILILMGFIGDVTVLQSHQVTETSTVSLVNAQPGHPATSVLELAAVAHQRWQTSRLDRKIIWTFPYYLDIVTYNTFRMSSPLSIELRELSIGTSQKVVHFIDQLQSKWNNLMPKGALYHHLNEVLFHGNVGRELLKTFNFKGEFFTFPEELLLDGIHPSPLLTDSLWKCLVRAAKLPARITPNPVPALAKLSVRERLSFSMPNLHEIPPTNSKWKGKGKGKRKRVNPYPSPTQNIPSLMSQQPYQPYPTSQSLSPYQAGPSQRVGGHWTTPPYHAPTVTPPVYRTQAPPIQTAPPPHSGTELLDETTDHYGHLTWRPLPAAPLPLGTVNYSCPQNWTWDTHFSENDRIQGRCVTNSIARQNLFREQAADIIRECALAEMRNGLNSNSNQASSTLVAHRLMYQFSSPPEVYQDRDHDLRDLMPPPALQ